ncbi:unnamed protein product [Lactuca saligna]|uniref:ZF-HD dimerization-type domain-containing protein n=1 Tax=Lactuca saligna TaxID=75948 RepID=A0AA35YX30_LACSI|nr:unnamed protein product [Lactuca saligna]
MHATSCSSTSITRLKNLNRRTVNVLASKLYFYYFVSYELTNDLSEIRGNLPSLHCVAILRHDELGQETLISHNDKGACFSSASTTSGFNQEALMEMSSTDKEIRMQTSSFPYNNHQLIHESSSEIMDHGSDPDRFDGSGASATPISVGSRLLKSPPPRYRECLKNYAANIGGSITDGCGEFMPSGDDGTLEALKCAACNCHRNFHRKETTTAAAVTAGPFLQLPPPLPSHSPLFNNHQRTSTSAVSLHHNPNWVSSINAPPVRMAVGGSGAATESSSEELYFTAVAPYGVAKKRFRSKFTQDQKEKMLEFAEKVGWRIPREDDPEVQRFCAEVGVKRQVLKVWMHNNKAISGKKQVPDSNENID